MQVELEERLKEHTKLKKIYDEDNEKRNQRDQKLDEQKEKNKHVREETEGLDAKIIEKLQINLERIIMIIDKKLKQEFEYFLSFAN